MTREQTWPGTTWYSGMEWDPHVEGWKIKDAPDGRRIWVVQLAFTAAIIIGPPDAWEYDDRWCYATADLAAKNAHDWTAEPGTEPVGWHRHPTSGRRRPDGLPANQYVMP